MTLPPEIRDTIQKRFEALLKEAEAMQEDNLALRKKAQNAWQNDDLFSDAEIQDRSGFYSLRTRCTSLVQLISNGSPEYKELLKRIQVFPPSGIEELCGIIKGLKDDFESGMLDRVVWMVEANIDADYLSQANRLLKEGKVGNFDYVPAAVLAGAVLEDALRRLCTRQNPPIALNKQGGSPKTMGTLISDLKAVNLFNELKAKQLLAWADIRNAAAHGKFTEFTRQDVEQMLKGIENFLADYM